MTRRLLLYVEGLTEELFVRRVLRRHLAPFQVRVEEPILAVTTHGPRARRGGFVNWPAIEADLRSIFLSKPDPNLRFSTLLDVYAMPPGVPGYPGTAESGHRSAQQVGEIESAWSRHFREPRFVPYLQRHEFEALVIANPDALARIFPQHREALEQLIRPALAGRTAEDVNDGRTTHPSARLAQAIPEYRERKASYGFFAVAEAGLPSVRARCPRFDAWLRRWEEWAQR